MPTSVGSQSVAPPCPRRHSARGQHGLVAVAQFHEYYQMNRHAAQGLFLPAYRGLPHTGGDQPASTVWKFSLTAIHDYDRQRGSGDDRGGRNGTGDAQCAPVRSGSCTTNTSTVSGTSSRTSLRR